MWDCVGWVVYVCGIAIGEGDCVRGISSSREVPPDTRSAEDLQPGGRGASALSRYLCLISVAIGHYYLPLARMWFNLDTRSVLFQGCTQTCIWSSKICPVYQLAYFRVSWLEKLHSVIWSNILSTLQEKAKEVVKEAIKSAMYVHQTLW